MSFINTANISCGISFTSVETNNLSKITDVGSVLTDVTLVQGTGESECDCSFHAIRTANGHSSDTLDLTALAFTLFDQDGTVSFNNIKGIVVKNPSESTGDIISVAATGSNSLISPFNGGSGNIPVNPTASIMLSNPILGWTIDASHKYLSIINNNATGVLYEICIVGVTG